MANRRRRHKLRPVREGRCARLDAAGRGVIVDEVERPVHVEGALGGERIAYRRARRRGDHDEGSLVELLEPSPRRVATPCPHATLCGGCSLQHLAPADQIAHKQAVLLELLRERGGVTPSRVLPPLLGPTVGYRRRARLGVRKVDKKGRVLVGFREKGGSLVADLEGCVVLAPPGGDLLARLSETIGELEIAALVPQVEYSRGDGEVALVFRVLAPPSERDLDRLRGFAARQRVRVFLQPGGLDTVAPLDGGDPLLRYRLDDFDCTFAFAPTDFVQVNAAINSAMVAQALALLEVGAEHRVLDLFCGLGNFTLPIARHARAVLGLESDAAMVERARANARANGIANAEFETRDLYAAGAAAPSWSGAFERVLLDPPRTGAEAVLAPLASLGAERIVYVACGPESLARDAGILVREHGYELAAAGMIDMFPHTAHFESMAVFVR